MEYRPGTCVDRWSSRVRNGRSWLQSQMVCRLPCARIEYIQCFCEQLVECAQCTSSTRFPEVRLVCVLSYMY